MSSLLTKFHERHDSNHVYMFIWLILWVTQEKVEEFVVQTNKKKKTGFLFCFFDIATVFFFLYYNMSSKQNHSTQSFFLLGRCFETDLFKYSTACWRTRGTERYLCHHLKRMRLNIESQLSNVCVVFKVCDTLNSSQCVCESCQGLGNRSDWKLLTHGR